MSRMDHLHAASYAVHLPRRQPAGMHAQRLACSLLAGWVLLTCLSCGGGGTAGPDDGTVAQAGAPRIVQFREDQSTTLLADGRVLVAGGSDRRNRSLASAEIYDPAAGAWTATGEMITGRIRHAATLLPDGRVLVAGGWTCPRACSQPDLTPLASAELYDPATGTWSSAGALSTARAAPAATTLADGRVLVAGGYVLAPIPGEQSGAPTALATADLFDPGIGLWETTGDLQRPRTGAPLLALGDGRAVIIGGWAHGRSAAVRDEVPQTLEVYDPAVGAWSITGRAPLGDPVWGTVLPDGRVLCLSLAIYYRPTAQIFDPADGTWQAISSSGRVPAGAVPAPLGDGRVLASGGENQTAGAELISGASALIFDASSAQWSATGEMGVAREEQSAIPLANGDVLVYGGRQWRRQSDGSFPPLMLPVVTSEVYHAATGRWGPR